MLNYSVTGFETSYRLATSEEVGYSKIVKYVAITDDETGVISYIEYDADEHIGLDAYVAVKSAVYGDLVRSALTAMGKYAFANTVSLEEFACTAEEPYYLYTNYANDYEGANVSRGYTAKFAEQVGYYEGSVFVAHFANNNFVLHIPQKVSGNEDIDNYTNWSGNVNILAKDIYLSVDKNYLVA
jgi:hypothetical protein